MRMRPAQPWEPEVGEIVLYSRDVPLMRWHVELTPAIVTEIRTDDSGRHAVFQRESAYTGGEWHLDAPEQNCTMDAFLVWGRGRWRDLARSH